MYKFATEVVLCDVLIVMFYKFTVKFFDIDLMIGTFYNCDKDILILFICIYVPSLLNTNNPPSPALLHLRKRCILIYPQSKNH